MKHSLKPSATFLIFLLLGLAAPGRADPPKAVSWELVRGPDVEDPRETKRAILATVAERRILALVQGPDDGVLALHSTVDLDGDGVPEALVTMQIEGNCCPWPSMQVLSMRPSGAIVVTGSFLAYEGTRVIPEGKGAMIEVPIQGVPGAADEYRYVGGTLTKTSRRPTVVSTPILSNGPVSIPKRFHGSWMYAVGYCRPLNFEVLDQAIRWGYPELGEVPVLLVQGKENDPNVVALVTAAPGDYQYIILSTNGPELEMKSAGTAGGLTSAQPCPFERATRP